MPGHSPSVKDLYKAITADLSTFVNEKSKDYDASRDTMTSYLDRFAKSNSNHTSQHHHGHHHHHSSSLPVASNTSIGQPFASTPVFGGGSTTQTHGHGATTGTGGMSSTSTAAAATLAPPGSAAATQGTGHVSIASSAAAGQRHTNEVWYQILTSNTTLQHPSNLPFAFHRYSQVTSNVVPPLSSSLTSQNASTSGSSAIGGAGAGTQSTGAGGSVTPTASASAAPSTSPALPSSSSTFAISNTASSPLAAQRFSAHLVTMFTQHGMDGSPIAIVATRVIFYLTHLLPFLTPQLVMTDWWYRLIEPSLQGEIRLEKDALKACRDLVTECMIRDSLMDGHGSGTGSILVAGDEEGQLDSNLAMATMPIPQFVLRKYIMAAHKLNNSLQGMDRMDQEGHSGAWLRAKGASSNAGHGSSGSGLPFSTTSYASSSSSLNDQWTSEYPQVLQDMEKQQRLLSKARTVIRRKKDILVKNLETILFAYGGNVGRVKDFFSCLYTYFVGARFRPEILGLLCQLIRRQYDTSPLIVSLGLMTLIMLMPRIPAAVNDRLPDLFMILSRILCWPRSRQQLMAVANQDGTNLTGQTIKSFDEFEDDGTGHRTGHAQRSISNNNSAANNKSSDVGWSTDTAEYEDIPLYSHGIRWRRYGPITPGGSNEGAPDPTAIFSFLYGLFPCNLLKFLHAPRLYMSQALSPTGSPKQSSGVPSSATETGGDSNTRSVDGGNIISSNDSNDNMVNIDEDLLKSRVQTLLKRHSLHPDLLTLTSEQELVNKARWQKLEPMEIVALCVGLDVWSAGGMNGTGPVLRSIEEDAQIGNSHVASDDDEDDDGREGHQPSTAGNNSSRLNLSADQDSSVQAQAHVSVESLGSEVSDGTPVEILAQEEFFGPRAIRDGASNNSDNGNPSRPLHGITASGFHRTTPMVHGQPRTRQRSKEVRMSQILQNFVTLRGLDHDEFLMEAASTMAAGLGPNLIMSGRRRSSAQKANERSGVTGVTTTAAAGAPAEVGAADSATDIAIEGSMALTTTPHDSSKGLDSIADSTTMSSLVLMNQEYRRTIISLERDLLMAKNELNFELFLKQQHIQQISKVHRAHVVDASVEAERQNLYNTCRSLKAQLQETRLLLEKEKSELEKRKNKQSHWDTELKNKMQIFRDERKQLQFEVERLKQDVKDTRQAQEIQERLLTEERKGTFQLKNTIEVISPKLKKMEEHEKRIAEMTRQLVLWETEQIKTMEIQRQLEAVVSRWQNLELLLVAEREEARVLRNRVSQQSQILDDMRIQMAISEGRGPDTLHETSSIDNQSESDVDEEDGSLEGGVGEVEGRRSRARHDGNYDEDIEDGGHADSVTNRDLQHGMHRKASGSLRHRISAQNVPKMGWPANFSRSNSNQTGLDQQQRAEAMQGFLAREKERWDKELQEAHNRCSREAMRNQELEDRILELQGQLEMARVIDVRQYASVGGNMHAEGSEVLRAATPVMNVPTLPQDVPYRTGTGAGGGMGMQERYTDGGDTDDGGIESSEMIGRYSQRRQETEDEDDRADAAKRSVRYSSRPPPIDERGNNAASASSMAAQHRSQSSSSSKNKGKSAKSKSKSKWPSVLERAHTDRGAYGTGLLDLSLHPGHARSRVSGESSSTMMSSSSSAGARAATAGLYAPIDYSRKVSQLSDGASSDMTTASDHSTNTSIDRGRSSGGLRGGSSTSSGVSMEPISEAIGSDVTGSGAAGGSATSDSKKTDKGKADKERERERDRNRLISGMGPLVDPSKMYRNVRMF
ncbi:hypothetical protein BG011_002377 [Mortierella polycephala]|uniref:Hamartin n=1 Tax=Mortierella polycephala TaxID=41804 RepID=A0A9P6U594_9FUNG|nr:hypothetical protein BG011_002377 [Mortierella polycephala]